MGLLHSRLNVCRRSLVGCRRTPQRGVSCTNSAPGPLVFWVTDTVKENVQHGTQGDMHAIFLPGLRIRVNNPLSRPLCRLARSVVAIVDDFSDHTLAAARQLGLWLVLAWVRGDRPFRAPGRRVRLDGLRPIVDRFHRATDLGWVVRRAKVPLDLSRDFRCGIER